MIIRYLIPKGKTSAFPFRMLFIEFPVGSHQVGTLTNGLHYVEMGKLIESAQTPHMNKVRKSDRILVENTVAKRRI